MHSRFRSNGVPLTALAALLALLVLPGSLLALPKPGAPGRNFRLMARAIGAITVNRVYCGLSATGEVCVDSSGSSTIGGGFWPKGTPQQYVFNSGLQAAGTIDAAAGFEWAGDTTGAFFFDPKGTTQHGEQVEPIWNSGNPADRANWPKAANVPQGDASENLFDPNLRGHIAASEADIWTIAWDGNPGQNAGRSHPLGIAVETRGMGWNFPTFNNDIVYFIYTFYNITSADPADYASIRPELAPEMADLGARFQSLNNAAFGVTIPHHGYTIKNFFANFSADMDVSSSAGANYSSVNLPFSLGYVYQSNFQPPDNGARLPPDISSGAFLNGYGFVGVKYLKSPEDSLGNQLGIRLFSNTVNGGIFNDPPNVQALYRYVTGNVNPAFGDGNCNYDPVVDKICYVKNDGPADMRFFQSSGPMDLAPGQFQSIVVAYEFASAVKAAGCPSAGCSTVLAGDPRLLKNAAYLHNTGANLIDSMTGFAGYTDSHDANGNPGPDGIVQQDEFKTVKGSLLAKALVAQTVFDNKFLLPSSPESPDFFLIPGDNQVTVVWRKSRTETIGDVFYPAAANPGTPSAPNLIYDPNYRKFDVEGYRVYRGRVDNPTSLTMLAQFDYAGTSMQDYLGVINPTPSCAPELGNTAGCPDPYTVPAPGNPYTVSTTYDIVSPFVQVKLGARTLLANGDAILLSADTAVTGTGSGSFATGMNDEGVPFTYIDQTAKNNLRYFYSVTAFDINSIQSGPSSLESARVTKAATPVHAASNYSSTGGVASIAHVGRGVNMDSVIPADPTIDPVTGEFSGPARPATGASMGFVGSFLSRVVSQPGQLAVTLLSLTPGSSYDGIPAVYTLLGGTDTVNVSIVQQVDNTPTKVSGSFQGAPLDEHMAARYGGSSAYRLQGAFSLDLEGTYMNVGFGRGCVNDAGHKNGSCGYDGARWFSGANESYPDPTRGNNPNFSNANITNPTNAGTLPGVAAIQEPRSYQTRPNTFRTVEGVLSSIATAADYRVYWGATAGTVDSVIDVTHNVPVQFATSMNYSWGFLTQAASSAAGSGDGRPGVLTVTDFGCVEPLRTYPSPAGHLGCSSAAPFNLVNTAALGALAFGKSRGQDGTNPVAANQGFGMYLAGHIFLFEMAAPATLPSSTVWTMRTYVGAIDGGGHSCDTACTVGDLGSYKFTPSPSPLTAIGAGLAAKYSSSTTLRPTTTADLDKVHTVPDPYYITNGYERSTTGKVIKFVNLPERAIIRIYSTSGVLVRVLEHTTETYDGSMDWDVRNRNNQIVASGVYFYAIEAGNARRVGRMTIVNFAQ